MPRVRTEGANPLAVLAVPLGGPAAVALLVVVGFLYHVATPLPHGTRGG